MTRYYKRPPENEDQKVVYYRVLPSKNEAWIDDGVERYEVSLFELFMVERTVGLERVGKSQTPWSENHDR